MITLDCIPCLLAHSLKAMRRAGVPKGSEKELFENALGEAKIMLDGSPAPIAAAAIYRLISEKTGNNDPFRDFKKKSTAMALEILPRLREMVTASDDPFARAIEFSIAGNAIDLVKMEESDLGGIIDLLEKSESGEFVSEDISALESEIFGADSVFVIGDNAGETVFDRLFLELINGPKVYYGVRGGPVLNDATAKEAEESGIGEIAEIISSESAIPGTVLEKVGEKFRKIFDEADVVIAKGQGNFETLDESPRPIYHLFKAKCEPIAERVGCNVGDFIVWKNSPNNI